MSPEQLFVVIARVSSDREMQERAEDISHLIKYCVKHGHWSIFEMVNICFYIKTSLPIALQLLRHKSFSFQMFSQRYQIVRAIDFPDFRLANEKGSRQSSEVEANLSHETIARLYKYFNESIALYNHLIKEEKVSFETARAVLPLSVSTELFMNGSLRSWIHYLFQRLTLFTQKEHRLLAQKIKQRLSQDFPITFEALESIKYFKNE